MEALVALIVQISSTILKQGSLELDQGWGGQAYSTVIQLRMLSEILSENIYLVLDPVLKFFQC